MKFAILFILALSATIAFAEGAKKKVSYRKTQEVDFEAADIDGQVRSPDGAYLAQKRGVSFLPLYKVNDEFEHKVLESVEYLR